MNQLLIIALAMGAVSADIGLTLKMGGYNYKVPHTSYGVPAYQYTHNEGDYTTGNAGAGGHHYHGQASSQAGYQGAGFGSQNVGHHSLGGGNTGASYQTGFGGDAGSQYYQTTGLNSGISSVPQPSYQYNTGAASQGGYQYQTSNQYQTSAVQKYQEYYNQVQQQPAQVFKHFYVHAAPEEPIAPRPRTPVVLPPPQKHYKIIFIKAPTQTVYTPQYIPAPQQNEEKTIVYVLVKNPEEQQEIAIPKVEHKAPTKPEVFFIKYKNKDESQSVINNIVNDYNQKGSSASFVNDVGSEQFSSGSLASQFGAGSGQYAHGGSGQYDQSSSGNYAQGSYDGQYQSAGQVAGTSTAAVGSSSFGGSAGQTVAVSTVDTSAGSAAHDASASAGFSDGVASSTASGVSHDSLNTISTSQGVPHETYGPPAFRP